MSAAAVACPSAAPSGWRGGRRRLDNRKRGSRRTAVHRSFVVAASAATEEDELPAWYGQQKARRMEQQQQSSWDAREASQDARGVDYLVELGKQSTNTNINVGARKGAVDDVFAGTLNAKFNLGAESDIASGKLRYDDEVRTFENIVGDFHVPPAFMDKVALHVAKNLLVDPANAGAEGNPMGNTKVPLILGIWGAKGCGKTFNLELACKALNISAVVMSAGELEDEWAGEPGRLLRRRYRKAAEIIKNQGKMSVLIVNDIDAGVGWFKQTQSTVNTQMVMGTLMNMCDHPERVSREEDGEIEEYREDEVLRRVPIIITGNDLSTLYAPLLRDGRMEKFYWEPTRSDIVDMVHAMFREDDVPRSTIEALVDTFPNQPLDFFGAIRGRMYDAAIYEWAEAFKSREPDASTGQRVFTEEMGKTLMRNRTRERPDDEDDPGAFLYWRPDFLKENPLVDVSLESLIRSARDLANEQALVNDMRLADEYMKVQKTWEEVLASDTPPPPEEVDEEVLKARIDPEARAAQEALMERARAAMRAEEERRAEERRLNPPPPPPPPEPEPEPEPEYPREWPVVSIAEAFAMFKEQGFPLVDVRGERDFNREAVVGSSNLPSVNITGRPLHWETHRRDGFEAEFFAAHPDLDAPLLILGGPEPETGEDGGAVVLTRLAEAGYRYTGAMEVRGGYDNWVRAYTPAGKKRTGKAKYEHVIGHGGTICVGSEIITQEDGVFDNLMRK